MTLPDANASATLSLSSLEEIEYLALKDLNGTSSSAEHRTNASLNDTNYELLPEPEKLIQLRGGNRPRPIAEKFDNLYLFVSDYPLYVFSLRKLCVRQIQLIRIVHVVHLGNQ